MIRSQMDDLKYMVAKKALEYIQDRRVIGIGSGTTINHFIDILGENQSRYQRYIFVPASNESRKRLESYEFNCARISQVKTIPVYIDGADEVDPKGYLIKGGGGALYREKLIASKSKKFVCLVHDQKMVERLGTRFRLPIEVSKKSLDYVVDEIAKLGGKSTQRKEKKTILKRITNKVQEFEEDYVTDNGNFIIDVEGLNIRSPVTMERTLNNICGVMENGIFAKRVPNTILIVRGDGNVSEWDVDGDKKQQIKEAIKNSKKNWSNSNSQIKGG